MQVNIPLLNVVFPWSNTLCVNSRFLMIITKNWCKYFVSNILLNYDVSILWQQDVFIKYRKLDQRGLFVWSITQIVYSWTVTCIMFCIAKLYAASDQLQINCGSVRPATQLHHWWSRKRQVNFSKSWTLQKQQFCITFSWDLKLNPVS